MNILLVASEALPFCKSGGLGDFIFSYSKALVKNGQKANVIIPLYKEVRLKHPETITDLYDHFDFKMSYRTLGCGIFHKVVENVNYFFVAMDRFDRDQLYGYGDDNERFACFMMAVNTFITRHNDFDVVHCNDWQSAVLPLLLTYNPKKIKTVLTIHNPAFQGWANKGDVNNFFNLSYDYYDSGYVRMGDSFNFLKTGIMASNKINTVSYTHAKELLSDHVNFGGIGMIIDWCRHYDFTGVVNGLDVDVWNPKTDKHLAANYDITNYKEAKLKNRLAILNKLGMDSNFKGPIYSAITRLSNQKGVDRIISIMPLLASQDARLIVIGTGEMEDLFLAEALKYKEVYFVKKYDEDLAHLLYAASDYFLMPSYFEPCGTSQMIAMHYGTIPIVSNVGGLNDTVKDLSIGKDATGFVFDNGIYNAFYECFKASLTFYSYDKSRVDEVIQNGMKEDFSWNKSAKEYLNLYNSIK